MRTIRPLNDGVLLRQDPKKEKIGTLYVPETTRELYEDVGTIVALGPKVENLAVGDRVMFKRRPASALEGEWEGLLMLKQEDVIGCVE